MNEESKVPFIKKRYALNRFDKSHPNPRLSLMERARAFLGIDPESYLQTEVGEALDLSFFDNKTYIPNTLQFSLLHFHKQVSGRQTVAFSCDYPFCGKIFVKWHNLFDHLRTHTGEKPFLCPVKGCHQAFNQVANQKKHLETHREKATLPCKGCDDKYTRRQMLKHYETMHCKEIAHNNPHRKHKG
jgi:hypothetical protein